MTTRRRTVIMPEKFMVRVETSDVDLKPGEGEILIETQYTLISSGTELSYFSGTNQQISMGLKGYPYTPGYCNVGTVSAVGPGVTQFRPGARVLSFAKHLSHALVRVSEAFSIPDEIAWRDALFMQMAGIALTGVLAAGKVRNSMVAVLGLGMLGNLAAQLAQADGNRVVGISQSKFRADLLRTAGIPTLNWSDEKAMQAGICDLLGDLPEVVIDATGRADHITRGLKLVRPRGIFVLFGSPRETIELDAYTLIHLPGVRMVGAHMRNRPAFAAGTNMESTEQIMEAMGRMICAGQLQCSKLITHEFMAEDAGKAYKLLADDHDQVLGVILKWQ